MYQQLIDDFIQREALPSSYALDAGQWFLPLFSEIVESLRQPKLHPLLVGINGAQGTGKSTLAGLLAAVLEAEQFTVATLSIDDFYLSKARRQQLANEVHPLLASRGVPGTHDIDLALGKIRELVAAKAGTAVVLPSFDKAVDDCLTLEHCSCVEGPLDLIILEGWFIGVGAQADADLQQPLNPLEELEDVDGYWRRYVNRQLAAGYQDLFAQFQLLIMLQAPQFEQVFEWRKLQEDKLRQRSDANADGLMDDAQLKRFIQHFERLTRHCLSSLPGKADVVFRLDSEHRVIGRDDLKKS